MAAHAILGASSSHKWLNCPPSARLEEQFENPTSVYAEEGTLAHSLGEALISNDSKAIKEIKGNPLYNSDMQQHCEDYSDFVLELLNEAKAITPDASLLLEQRLDFSKWVEEGFGTGDAVIVADGVMRIIDLKYGQGVEVSAHENTQMMLYALGAYNSFEMLYDIKSIIMTIYQPRIKNYSSYEISVVDLLTWAVNVLVPAAKLAYEGKGAYKAGEHCRFCRAKHLCKALAEYNLEPTEPEMKPSELLNDEEIINILNRADSIKKWLSSVEEYAFAEALNGKKWEGYKLVEGRSNRTYSDPDKVADTLINAGIDQALIYEKKIKTITALEKDLGKKPFNEIVGELIIKPAGKPTLVPEGDKRPEWNSADGAAEDFKNVNI
mgnify:FL=1